MADPRNGYINPVFETVRATYGGPVTLCQDLTVFDVTPGAVVVRQATISLIQQAAIGSTENQYALGRRTSCESNDLLEELKADLRPIKQALRDKLDGST